MLSSIKGFSNVFFFETYQSLSILFLRNDVSL